MRAPCGTHPRPVLSPEGTGSYTWRTPGLFRRFRGAVEERLEELDREREQDRRVLLGRDLDERLEVAELQGAGRAGDDVGRLSELLGGLELALGGDHLRAPLAL